MLWNETGDLLLVSPLTIIRYGNSAVVVRIYYLFTEARIDFYNFFYQLYIAAVIYLCRVLMNGCVT